MRAITWQGRRDERVDTVEGQVGEPPMTLAWSVLLSGLPPSGRCFGRSCRRCDGGSSDHEATRPGTVSGWRADREEPAQASPVRGWTAQSGQPQARLGPP